jgi:predicted short-subunit dehydrogenase-like oxidoreductase (DUF2520 family)
VRAWRSLDPRSAVDASPEPMRDHIPDPVTATRPRIGFVGAGHVGTALAVAFRRAGWPVSGAASRSPDRREAFERLVPDTVAVADARELLDLVDVLFVTVPDDAIANVVAGMRLYSGQGIVHTSGLLPSTVLEPALAAGSAAASFHPLVAFADLDRAVAAMSGAAVALEGDEQLVAVLADLAGAVGATPIRVATSGKAAYHAAATLAAGGFVGLLETVVATARLAGLDDEDALAAYGPLARQALANVEELGTEQALTGPVGRGDAGTVEAHLAVLHRLAPAALEVYRALGRAQLAVAERRGGLSPEAVARLRALLANDAGPGSM